MDDYVATTTFAELPLSEELRKGIAELGYEKPTPVQAVVFAPILAGRDLIVRSKDGTGYLIDFKSAKRIEPAGMLVVLRQILTYALMDEGDELGLTQQEQEAARMVN